jgi:hypothetical protein
MTLDVRFKFVVTPQFYNVTSFISEYAIRYFEESRERYEEGVRSRMREASGDEKRGVESVTIAGPSPRVLVYNTTVQGWIDEYGLEPGKVFPPFGEDSQLFDWVVSVLNPQAAATNHPRVDEGRRLLNAQLGATFAVALSINERGFPGPNDYIHAPFHNTFLEEQPEFITAMEAISQEAAQYVNGLR